MSAWSPVTPATPEVKRVCTETRSQVQIMTGVNFPVYVPVEFISKNEGGTSVIYIIKVDVGSNDCVHAKIFQGSGGELNLQGALYPKPQNDPLVPF